ncbi:MAG: hypothetical protein M3Z98_03365 [Candidatus Dormibacteraeota bacterium]|nr:hypothetical protein [Candidatus Dormibacteraeota bacterium]
MNCAQARPLLLAGDPGAEVHLEGCAACGAWLEKHDPLVRQFRAARPEALPAPAALSRRVLDRWAPAGRRWRRWAVPAGLVAATFLLVAAAAYGVVITQADLLATVTDRFSPVVSAFSGPRDLLLSSLPGLVGLAGLSVLSFALAVAFYRELGRAPGQLAR